MLKQIAALTENELQALAALMDGGIRQAGFNSLCPEWVTLKYKLVNAQDVAEAPPTAINSEPTAPSPPVDKGA